MEWEKAVITTGIWLVVCISNFKASWLRYDFYERKFPGIRIKHKPALYTAPIVFRFLLLLFSLDEFIQAVQSTAGMAIVSLIRTVMGSGDEIASVVSQHLWLYANVQTWNDSRKFIYHLFYLLKSLIYWMYWNGASVMRHLYQLQPEIHKFLI